MNGRILVFILSLGVVFAAVKENPLSDEFIMKINKAGSTWKAGRNFASNTNPFYLKALLGALPGYKSKLSVAETKLVEDLPQSFDARDEWPDCDSIKTVSDQSTCGSSWAFGAVEAISDRICIHSNGTLQVSISANDLLSCCDFTCGKGCEGGWPEEAWSYWVNKGIVSGGLYESTDGCQSYVFPPCAHSWVDFEKPCGESKPTPTCTAQCDNSSLIYNMELHYGKSYYRVETTEEDIKSEIYTNGPVEASFDVYSDFYSYKSGVYQWITGDYVGGHAVKLLGWGYEQDVPYWLVANSWGEYWGDEGYFKIIRGGNECDFEKNIVAGLP